LARLRSFFQHPVRNLVALALTLQGLRGISKSLRFIFVEYPLIEQQLQAHTLTNSQVNEYAIGAILLVTATALSLFFAMRIAFLHNKVAKGINTALSIALIIGNQFIHDYLTQFDLSSQTETIFTQFLN